MSQDSNLSAAVEITVLRSQTGDGPAAVDPTTEVFADSPVSRPRHRPQPPTRRLPESTATRRRTSIASPSTGVLLSRSTPNL
jgi:hypothetical protein